LKEPDNEIFNVKTQEILRDVGPKTIFDFTTLSGEIGVHAKKRAALFCEGYEAFVKNYE